MPFIKVEAWEGFNDEQKKEWAEKLTEATVNLFSLPADKVIVVISENKLTNWTQGGIVASDPDFLEKSRRTTLEA